MEFEPLTLGADDVADGDSWEQVAVVDTSLPGIDARALAFDEALDAECLYTTDEILTEFLTFYSEGLPHARRQATMYARNILADASVVVLPQTHTSFLEGLTLYESRVSA